MKLFSPIWLAAAVCTLSLATLSAAEGPIFPALHGDLVSVQNGKVAKFDETALAQTKYFAIYYSAEWCPPCRAFTPELVKWYHGAKAKNPHFELIFVSSDRAEPEMEKYMTGDKMPWPGLAFNKKKSNRTLTQYSGPGIPCLVLLDAQGKVLSHSYEGKNYVGPHKVLKDIEATLKQDPAPAGGATPAGGSGSGFDDFFKKKPAQ